MKKIKIYLVITSLINLISCAGAPIGWGGTYQIDTKSKDSITISYDDMLESYEDVVAIANEHCESYGKVANAEALYKDSATEGLIKTYIFNCNVTEQQNTVRVSEYNYPGSLFSFNKEPELILESNPTGAMIFIRSSQKDGGESFTCMTPCTIQLNDASFNDNPEMITVLGAKWQSGAYRWVSLYAVRGRNTTYTFERPMGGDVNADLVFAESITPKKQTTPILGFIADALVLSAYFYAAYQGLPTYQQPRSSSSPEAPSPILSRTQPEACVSNFSCSSGQVCVKAPLEVNGICMATVDEYGLQTYNPYSPSGVQINTDIQGQCSFNADCPINFSCDSVYKVCRLK